ncbi:MAG: hypothetical protein JNM70_01125 [Anaerolineae bacterium]|nr:hypothetical protein [Anaerolineae bacterium]
MEIRRNTLQKITRFRLRFTFWLDMHKADEHDLAETIDTLKSRKLFVKTIRDGIRLVCSLMEGRLDVLFDLYPWVREEFEQRAAGRASQTLEAQLARLELLMGQGGGLGPLPQSAGPKPLQSPALALPRFDDEGEDMPILLTRSASTNVAYNLINSMKNLQ